jgi:hypothetical protein
MKSLGIAACLGKGQRVYARRMALSRLCGTAILRGGRAGRRMTHAALRGDRMNTPFFLSGRKVGWIVVTAILLSAVAAPAHVAAAEIAPWPDRAEVAAREFVLVNAQQLANSIQRIAHPEGRNPELTNLDVSRVEDRLLVRIAIIWSTTSARRTYASWIYWEFGEEGHRRAQVVSYSTPTKITAKNAALLEEHFREKIYPAVMRGVGPSELH